MREGPDALPRSGLLLGVTLAAIIAVTVAEAQVIVAEEPLKHVVFFATMAFGIAAYWLVLQVAGYPQRFVQTVIAGAGCGALLSVISVMLYLALQPIIGMENAFDIRLLILLWSLTVDGHIIARATAQHLVVGLSVACAIFFVQIVIYSAF